MSYKTQRRRLLSCLSNIFPESDLAVTRNETARWWGTCWTYSWTCSSSSSKRGSSRTHNILISRRWETRDNRISSIRVVLGVVYYSFTLDLRQSCALLGVRSVARLWLTTISWREHERRGDGLHWSIAKERRPYRISLQLNKAATTNNHTT